MLIAADGKLARTPYLDRLAQCWWECSRQLSCARLVKSLRRHNKTTKRIPGPHSGERVSQDLAPVGHSSETAGRGKIVQQPMDLSASTRLGLYEILAPIKVAGSDKCWRRSLRRRTNIHLLR
jgi:hypothetical protein